jgi:methylenetetrahydrofolate reductase (NADPH)
LLYHNVRYLGYDIDKYEELLLCNDARGIDTPMLASLYMLDLRSARAMHGGRVPGVHVPESLYSRVAKEWQDPAEGKRAAIERMARLGAVLKGIGYRGIHLGGIHDNFETVARVLDRMDELAPIWQEFREEFTEPQANRFYLYRKPQLPSKRIPSDKKIKVKVAENCHYLFLRTAHDLFFDKQASLAPLYRKISTSLEKSKTSWLLKRFLEDPFKKVLLSCQSCGDCGIQHVGFICPESGCPKHTRNGACGGSSNGYCEVNTDKLCVWVRAYTRMKRHGETEKLNCRLVPPRSWDLKDTSSWINFHLDRDHQKTAVAPPGS